MISEEYLLNVLRKLHFSEKAASIKKYKTIIFKVTKDATKEEIKAAINKIFNLKINKINTLLVKNYNNNKKFFNKRSKCKKAYIFFKKNQNLEFLEKIK